MEAVGLHKRGGIELGVIFDYFSKLPRYHEAGAIACFVGIVREDPVNESEAKVTRLEYEAYGDVALKRMEEIRDAIKNRPGIVEVSIHHIIDTLTVGEPSLFVAVLGKHRQDVFPAITETVERVKREVLIWKKEFTTKESHWASTESSYE